MTSTYSNNLKLELMVTGANASTWGDNTNNNLNIVDAYTSGVLQFSVANTSPNIEAVVKSATSNAAHKVIEFTGTLTGATIATIPAVEGNYLIFNNTTANGHTFSVAPYGHTGNAIELSNGSYSWVYNTSSNVVKNGLGTLGDVTISGNITDVTGNATVSGVTTLNGNVAIDTDTFFVDSTNNAAGFFTTTPEANTVNIVGNGQPLRFTGTSSSSTGGLNFHNDSVQVAQIDVAGGQGRINLDADPNDTQDGSDVRILVDGTVVADFGPSLLNLDSKLTVANSAVAEAHTLSNASTTVALDLSVGNNFTLTMNNNMTLSNPTNETVGQCGFIILRQDATGTREISFGSKYKFIGGSGGAPNLASRTADQVDRLDYVVVSGTEIHVNATGPYS